MTSRRSRGPSRLRQHLHCDSCYSRRCRTRAEEASVCCALGSCRLLCGAVYHLCKEEEHLLLCPNARVPCLNAEYGCSLQVSRSAQAAHLQVCPASVVCCSMEWNRWPANDAQSHQNPELFENLLREGERSPSLDLAMALKDQETLFHSLKMKNLFPELIQSVEEEEREERKREEERREEKERKKKALLEKEAAEKAAAKEARDKIWESINSINAHLPVEMEDECECEAVVEVENKELSQEMREAIARGSGVDAELLDNYNAWERMFSMERGRCRESEGSAAAGSMKTAAKGLSAVSEEDTCAGAAASAPSCLPGKPTKKRFVYGHLEPMKIVTVRTFKVPTSFTARQGRIRNPAFYKRENEAVDTSDLGVAPEDMPVWEEVQASLLCSLERERRGNLVAETISSDSLLTDEGTQTYSFLSAPFRRNMSLADVTAGKLPELHLQLQVESVTSRHNKASSAFTFLCGHSFQRREYGRHYLNIHSHIQMGVSGWFEQRCPLAYLGCTYSQRRFQPATQEATVHYNEQLGCFSLHPTTARSLCSASSGHCSTQSTGAAGDTLSSLPYEVLCHTASFLDSLSLSQLALVSRLMRQVCSSQLQGRGMVTLRWGKRHSPDGRPRWRVTHRVWQFSTMFSPVDAWCFRSVPSISEHLKTCPYNETERRTEKIRLPRIQEEATATRSCKGPSLVNLFQHKRTMM